MRPHRLAAFAVLLSLTMMLAGCSNSPSSTYPVLSTQLPSRPAANFTKPVALPAIAAGMQPETVLGACLVRLDTANGRISSSWAWYDFVRQFGRAPTDAELKPK